LLLLRFPRAVGFARVFALFAADLPDFFLPAALRAVALDDFFAWPRLLRLLADDDRFVSPRFALDLLARRVLRAAFLALFFVPLPA
jgi:hypothetical protein